MLYLMIAYLVSCARCDGIGRCRDPLTLAQIGTLFSAFWLCTDTSPLRKRYFRCCKTSIPRVSSISLSLPLSLSGCMTRTDMLLLWRRRLVGNQPEKAILFSFGTARFARIFGRREFDTISVVNILRKWLQLHFYDFEENADVLNQLIAFVERTIKAHHPVAAARIIQSIQEKVPYATTSSLSLFDLRAPLPR